MSDYLLYGAALWFSVHWAYVIAMAAKARLDNMTLYWKIMLAPVALVGLVLDILFNYTFGWLMFLEWPWDTGEKLFSGRVQYHFRRSDGWRLKLSEFWERNLNLFDPNHISRR